MITKTKKKPTKLTPNSIIKDELFLNSNISNILDKGRSDSYTLKSVSQNMTHLSKEKHKVLEKHKDKIIKNYATF